MNICICVRKRPLFDKEYQSGEIDAVSASNPRVVVHQPMYKGRVTQATQASDGKQTTTQTTTQTAT